MSEYITCPFCNEEDFDLIGLKDHFVKGYCDVFNETERGDYIRQQPLSGSPEGSPKLCPQCGDKDIVKHDISGLVCINCGHNFR